MCGICGQLDWRSSPRVQEGVLKAMNQAIHHRGPDDDGFYQDSFSYASGKPGAVGLAMRRLSIIDLSSGKQPITNETGDVVVVYNGETYNYKDLRSELTQAGHTFKTQTDTETLAHGYEQWGLDMPEKLNGMFGFALWDKKQSRLILARDRMGIKPLYYAILNNKLVFGSEIKALLQDPDVPKDIDESAVDDFLSMRYIPTPKSIYKSIQKLEPATMLIWEKGEVRFKKYWSYSPKNEKDKGLSYYLEKTDALLDDSVKRQLVSDVPIGTFLSGGLDSPAISYYAKKHKPDLLSFNIYFPDKSFSEREEAKAVANFIGTNHVEKEVTADVLDLIPKLIDTYDEPFADDSMIPTYILTQMAREHMTVALSGDGGDELFGGYPTYIADRMAMTYRKLPKFLTATLLEPLVNKLPVSFDRISLDYKAKAFIRAARRPSPLEHFGWTEIFPLEVMQDLYKDEFQEKLMQKPLAESYVRAFNEAGSRQGIEKFLYVDQRTHMMDEFLVKVDRASMANSLEVRPPFLDHRIVELAAEIPMTYKVKGFTTKYIIRRLMKGRIPKHIIHGAKKGFSPPTARWLANELFSHIKMKFDPGRIKDIPYFNSEFPKQLLEEHVARKANHNRRLWTLLMFVEWYDRKVLGRK